MRDFAAFLRPISSRASKMATLVTFLLLMSMSASAQYYGYYQFTVYNPTAGQTYTRGTTMTINWTYDYNPAYIGNWVALDYSSDGGSSWTNIVGGLYGGTTSYDWAIPPLATPSTQYYIRVYEQQNYSWAYTYNTDGYGGAFAVIKNCTAPIISTSPQPATVCAGTAHTFNVSSDMTDGTYQWKKDGIVVATTSVPSYTINPVNSGHAGAYSVTLTDACSTPAAPKVTNSGTANLVVNLAPAITQQPQPTVTICQSGRDTLKARGIGVGRTFQWQKDGVNIPFATDSNYVVDNAPLTTSRYEPFDVS